MYSNSIQGEAASHWITTLLGYGPAERFRPSEHVANWHVCDVEPRLGNNQDVCKKNVEKGQNPGDSGRTYPPVTKAKFVRDVGGSKDYQPGPTKRLRAEHNYEEYEARKQPTKQLHKISDTKPVKPVQTLKVIEKPATYASPERKEPPSPKPQRAKTRQKPNPTELSSDATKSVENTNKQVLENTNKAVKNVTANVPDNKAPEKPAAESNDEGVCELTDLMASVLQDELNQIMIKVWQELPDDPPTDAEELVAEKFRNEAGDDLQNAMGLNVTARLLNVHNPLYAKLEFSGKPEAGCLQAFITEYKISAFKRIADSSRDLFAARFDHIADFDKLCVHSEVKCGSATVTIFPCYKYFSAPPTLKSIYATNMAKAKKNISTVNSPKPNNDKKETALENVETDKAKYAIKIITEKDNSVKPVNNASTVTANATVASKSTVVKAPEQVKPEAAKETPKDIPATKKVTPKTIENKVDKKNNIDDNKTDKEEKTDTVNEMMVVDEEMEEDDEEMTDQDILALMSGGIVLDECSGSDEDK